MLRLMSFLFRDRHGATAIEYALMASLVSIALITAGSQIGGAMGTNFNTLAARVSPNASR